MEKKERTFEVERAHDTYNLNLVSRKLYRLTKGRNEIDSNVKDRSKSKSVSSNF